MKNDKIVQQNASMIATPLDLYFSSHDRSQSPRKTDRGCIRAVMSLRSAGDDAASFHLARTNAPNM